MSHQTKREMLTDLRDRLHQAETNTQDLIGTPSPFGPDDEYFRLSGKAEGVRLALSYVEEMLRA